MTDSQTLRDIRHSKKHSYEVRTRHLAADGEPVFINQLIDERSPYLLQHAHNPVNWHSWSDETFDKAKSENKPVFLSIGYSTCHWCHVMEEESFDDQQVAVLLNQYFIAVKVDREQRPDIDNIYMTAVQLITGRGGWPMSVFLTPEGEPFYGATYFQKPHFMRLLERIQKLWHNDRHQLYQHASQLTSAIKDHLAPPPEIGVIPDALIAGVCQQLMGTADKLHGGFGDAPKFPQEAHLLFLLDQLARQPTTLSGQPLWKVVKHALDAMLQGGIYDQLAGGFHRYSTDNYWLIPHFEKMLYNQGQLVRVYNQGFRLCKDPEYQRVACETLDYVLREMRTDSGLFYSATDADSEGVEGKFFVWTADELRQALSNDEFELIQTVWGVKQAGNFEGANVLFLPQSLPEAAQALGLGYSALVERLKVVKTKLRPLRSKRIPPLRDAKVIAEWNGMMIAALAEASQIFARPDYMAAAITAVDRLWVVHRRADGSLWRISMDGEGSESATLEDYAHLMEALLEVYDGTGQAIYLQRCQALATSLLDNHWDEGQGGYYTSPETSAGPMLVRSKSLGDNATICGNSQILIVLNRLWRCTGDAQYLTTVRQHVAAFAESISQQPLSALMFVKGLAEIEQANPVNSQYFGGGQIQARLEQAAQLDDRLTLSVRISITDGWHIQCPQKDNNEANNKCHTHVSLVGHSEHRLVEVIYPQPEQWPVLDGGNAEVYTESCTIMIRLQCHSSMPVRLAIQLQACYETACMAPEVKELVYWPDLCRAA